MFWQGLSGKFPFESPLPAWGLLKGDFPLIPLLFKRRRRVALLKGECHTRK